MKQINTFFRITACILLCAVLSACFGTPEPVEPPAPVVETAAPTDGLDGAIREASIYLNSRIPKGSKIVFLNMKSDYPDLSEYILSILSENAVNDGAFSVVDRQQLDVIRAELDFQMSGEVSDESAQSIGKMLGAERIVSGSINKIGPLYRVQVKAIDVEIAGVQGQWSRNIPADEVTISVLAERYIPAPASGTVQIIQARTQAAASSISPLPVATVVPVQAVEQEPVIPIPVIEEKVYKIGDTGPAGGIIFYDKGNNSGGWRYLEAAPADIAKSVWQNPPREFEGTKDTIGSGKQNTQLIGENGRAILLILQYRQGGFSDWFLPSKAELDLMYINLQMKDLGNFSDGWYWSSTTYKLYSTNYAWAQRFSDGSQDTKGQGETYSVRPIRQF